MDTKKIKALIKVVELGSFTSAAEELGYTQPGITNMMNALESELGITLLSRGKSGVHLTDEGSRIYQDFLYLVDASDSLEKKIDEIKFIKANRFRVGAYSSVARHWLPAILEKYKYTRPDAEMVFVMQDIKEAYNAVKANTLDCAIVSYQEDLLIGLDWTPLRDDPLVAVLPGSYSEDEGSFPVSFFADMDFLVPAGGWELDYGNIFADMERLPNFKRTNLDDGTIASMVSHGLGVTIMSELVMKSIHENVAVVSLSPAASRKFGIITKRKTPNAKEVKRFIATAIETLESI